MHSTHKHCPKCQGEETTKSGIVQDRQRYRCKQCGYHFSVDKIGRQVDPYYVTKALQLYLEGISLREIERLLGISHASVLNWVKAYGISRIGTSGYRPTYQIVNHSELLVFMQHSASLKGMGMIITEVGDKYMIIKWERFRK